jgi:Golgi nucleoside diphosphatase
LAARRGKKRAIIAIGHSILKSVYHVIGEEKAYRELGASYVNKRQEHKRKAYLKKELEKLGFNVNLMLIPEKNEKTKIRKGRFLLAATVSPDSN